MLLLQQVYYATFAASIVAVAYMMIQYRGVVAMSEGTENMSFMAARIRKGAKVFEFEVWQKIAIAALVLAVLICLFVDKCAAIAFLMGGVLTTIVVIVGMSVATYANVRATAVALDTVDEDDETAGGKTVSATAKASQICGISVQTALLFGLALVGMIWGFDPFAEAESFIKIEGFEFVASIVRVTAYGLGWSIVAMFCRVPGGIFTKAADIGADLIGKVEFHFKEDDHRNPAVLADQVGDNVNDVAGNQADLGESTTATPNTTIITAITMYATGATAILEGAIAYPFIVLIGGLISSIIGLYYASHAKKSKNPAHQINMSMYIAATGALLSSLLASYICFYGNAPVDFKAGWMSPFLSTVFGIVAGVGVGLIAQKFTDMDSWWAKYIAERADKGPAIASSLAQAAGWISCFPEIGLVLLMSYFAEKVTGPYGGAVMALGMLSFVAQAIGADAFGPISDNAGGIAECCELPPKVRQRTDKNDAFGNESAAVGKAFAISSAAAVVKAQLTAYAMTYRSTSLNLLEGDVTLGIFIGVGMMAMFCGLLAKFTLDAATVMADECRRQLMKPEVRSGEELPDAEACIRIATKYALNKMVIPVAIVVIETLAVGFIFGADALGGAIGGSMYIGFPLAIYFSNTGGLSDNVKKRFEAGLVECFGDDTDKYNLAYAAAIIIDTIGDWMKDVVATAIDIFMKIEGVLGLMLAPAFDAYHLL
ncbi:sodium/proton-translocating pyrophosphatase [Candidatus Saccharibacteria bacterium]|nr:sodium/proton-translocating pyrophosphatase [Candidatus Saccharibacteria bacterium]